MKCQDNHQKWLENGYLLTGIASHHNEIHFHSKDALNTTKTTEKIFVVVLFQSTKNCLHCKII